jgi:hypothetical protein
MLDVCLLLILLCCCGMPTSLVTVSAQPANLASTPFPLSEERINKTYNNVLPCLKKRWNGANIQELHNFSFPKDALEHYNHIINITAKYRKTPMHSYAEYSGPWIENWFINSFVDKPLEYFNGLIPLFVQWIDNHLLNKLKEIENELNKVLRKDVIYFAVSQGDNGLEVTLRVINNHSLYDLRTAMFDYS